MEKKENMEEERIREQAPMNFSVARMSPGDLPAAAALEREVFSDFWSEAMLSSGFETPSQLYFCAKGRDGALAGYAAVMIVLDEGELLRIGVFPKFRGRGVASMLMEAIVRTAEERKLAFMTLEARQGNAPAIKLYEKYGFSPESVRRNYYRSPAEDALIMRRVF